MGGHFLHPLCYAAVFYRLLAWVLSFALSQIVRATSEELHPYVENTHTVKGIMGQLSPSGIDTQVE